MVVLHEWAKIVRRRRDARISEEMKTRTRFRASGKSQRKATLLRHPHRYHTPCNITERVQGHRAVEYSQQTLTHHPMPWQPSSRRCARRFSRRQKVADEAADACERLQTLDGIAMRLWRGQAKLIGERARTGARINITRNSFISHNFTGMLLVGDQKE